MLLRRSMNSPSRPRRSRRGFSLVEVLIIVAIIGLIAVIVMPLAAKAIRRARALSAISGMDRVLAKARLSAIQRGCQVVVQFAHVTTAGDRIQLTMWEDRNPDFQLGTYTPPGGGAPVPETVIQTFTSEPTFHVWKYGQTMDDYGVGVAFNGYGGDSTLTSRIAFLPTGAIVLPQDPASGTPTSTDGRGVYIADVNGSNFFRLTIPNPYVSRARIEKWIDTSTGYSAQNWTWR